jgi:hypothetical protein
MFGRFFSNLKGETMIDYLVSRRRTYGRIAAAALCMALLSACGVHKPFELMNGNYQLKPGSVAVVTGSNDEATTALAGYLTEELKQKGTMHVMSQEEVARHVPKYPSSVKRAKEVEDLDHPVWYAAGEKGKIDSMQQQLKSGYLFVVWGGNLYRTVTYRSNGGADVTYSVGIVANLIEPRNKVVGYSNFGRSKGQSCCLFGKSEGDDINQMLKEAAEEMADDFLKTAKAQKAGS